MNCSNANGSRRLIDIGNKNWRRLVLCECGIVVLNSRPAMKCHIIHYHDSNDEVQAVAVCKGNSLIELI